MANTSPQCGTITPRPWGTGLLQEQQDNSWFLRNVESDALDFMLTHVSCVTLRTLL